MKIVNRITSLGQRYDCISSIRLGAAGDEESDDGHAEEHDHLLGENPSEPLDELVVDSGDTLSVDVSDSDE